MEDLPGNMPGEPQPIDVQELIVDEVDVPEWARVPAPVANNFCCWRISSFEVVPHFDYPTGRDPSGRTDWAVH